MAGRGTLTAQLDMLLSDRLAERYESIGTRLANLRLATTLSMAVLAGALVGASGTLAQAVASSTRHLPFGLARLLEGLALSLGLIPVMIGGVGLFAADVPGVIAGVNRRIRLARVLRNLALVYVGNGLGAGGVALVAFGALYNGATGEALRLWALSVACQKCDLGFVQALALGFMGSVLVCLAAWLSLSAHSTGGKILALVFPVTAFAAAGFEHAAANLYYVLLGLLIQRLTAAGVPDLDVNASALTLQNFLAGSLLPVTLGNILGGPVLVGLVYWFIYLRPRGRRNLCPW